MHRMIPHFGDFSHWDLVDELSSQHTTRFMRMTNMITGDNGVSMALPACECPEDVIQAHCAKYMRRGKPIHLMQRVSDSAYSIVAQYPGGIQRCRAVLPLGLQPTPHEPTEVGHGNSSGQDIGQEVQDHPKENLHTCSKRSTRMNMASTRFWKLPQSEDRIRLLW